jgi:prepilin-type N-terminal cleavage/methylation domain-containing protein
MNVLRARRRGVTLIEMLVTLVLVGMIAGILAQALAQLARIERALEGGQLGSMVDAVRAEWVRSAIESLLPGAAGTDERLRGDASELKGLSADVPMLPAPGLAALHLRLAYRDALGATQLELVAASAGSAGDGGETVVLLSWPGRQGRLRYLDAQGEWQDRWPAASGTAAALPRAIALETGIESMRFVLAVPRASEVPLPTRRQAESL